MQPINVRGYVSELPSLFPAHVCAALRERADGEIVATGPHYPARYRNNDRAVFHDQALADELWDTVGAQVPDVVVDARGRRWRAVGLNAHIRVCRYSNGQAFTRHRDGAWHGDGVRSWLTFQLYLDDGFEGGRTRFYTEVPRGVIPREGSAVVFDHQVWHDGEPVTRGTKHVLRSDVLFRPLFDDVEDGHQGYVWRLATHPDGVLSTGRDGTVRLWSPDGWLVHTWRGPGGSVGPVVARGAGWVGGTRDGRLVTDAGLAVQAHDGAVLDLARLGDGLVSCGADGVVCGWSDTSGTIEPLWRVVAHQGWVWRLWVAGTAVWTVGDDGVLACTRDGHTSVVGRHDVGLTAVGDDVLGDERGGVFDFSLRELGRHDGRVRAVVRVGSAVWSAGEDDLVSRHDADGSTVVRRHDDFVTDVLPMEEGIASCSYDGTVRFGEPTSA